MSRTSASRVDFGRQSMRRAILETLETRQLLAGVPAVVGSGTGLIADYYADTGLANLAAAGVDGTVHFNWGVNSPAAGIPADGFAARWVGRVQAQYTETYTFYVQADEGVRLTVYTPDNSQAGGRKANVLVDAWGSTTAGEYSGALALQAGETYDLVMEYKDTAGEANVSLNWSSASTPKTTAGIPMSQLYPTQSLSSNTLSGAWINSSIGLPAGSGALTSTGPVYKHTAQGTGISGTSDQLEYGYQYLQGDAIAVAKVRGITGTGVSSDALAGLMVRETTEAGSRYAAVVWTAAGVKLMARTAAGAGASTIASTAAVAAPVWIKLVRHGPTVTAYTSPTGTEESWTYLGRVDLKGLADQVMVGLASAAGEAGKTVAAGFGSVDFRPDIPLGANLGGVATYAGTMPMIDYIRSGASRPVKLTVNGSSVSISDTAASVSPSDYWPTEDFGFAGPYLQRPDGFSGYNHVLTFSGKATVGSDWASISFTAASSATGDAGYVNGYNSTTNSSKYYLKPTSFAYSSNNTALRMYFRNTQRTAGSATNTGLTDVRLFQAGYSSDSENDVYTKEWIAAASRLKVLRFMDWAHTNGNLDTNWSDRTFPYQHFDQHTAWEYMVQLANKTRKDMWINVPAHASADYIQKLANLLRYGSNGSEPFTSDAEYQAYPGTKYPGLDPDLNVYLEYSNEVWNYAFEVWNYASAQANAAYAAGTTYGPNNVTLNFDGSNPGAGSQERTNRWLAAHLVGSIVPAFRNAFGADSINARVRPVLCGWQGFANTTIAQSLAMVKAAGWDMADSVYAASVTGYFGYTDLAQAQVAQNADRNSLTTDDALRAFLADTARGSNAVNFRSAAATANSYGVKLVAYESGPSIGTTAAQAAAQRDPRFRQVQTQGMNNWFMDGAELSNYFAMSYTSAYGSQYGDWVFSDNRWDENQPRAQSYWDIRNADQAPPITAGFTALPSGELEARYHVGNSVASANTTTYLQPPDWQTTALYYYQVRSVEAQEVALRLSAAATAANQRIRVYVNSELVQTLDFAAAAANDAAGNRIFTDQAPVTIRLSAGMNVIMLSLQNVSNPSSAKPRLNSLKFSPVGQTLTNALPWAHGVPTTTQNVPENSTTWTLANLAFNDSEHPSVANQASPFAVMAVSDNPGLLPAGGITWTYTASTNRWTMKVVPVSNMTGKANVTLTVTDPSGAQRSWVIPFAVVPATPTGFTATAQGNGTVSLGWTNPSTVTPRFVVERSPDNNVWTTIATTAAGATSYSDLPPGNSRWYYRVSSLDAEGRQSAKVTSSAINSASSSAGGVGLNASSLFAGKTYFSHSLNNSASASRFFDATMTDAQFGGSSTNLAITAIGGAAAISVITFAFPNNYNSYNSYTTVIPTGVSIYYSTTNHTTSANALNTANYTRLGSSTFALNSAKTWNATDGRYETTLRGLSIPAGVQSVLLVFDSGSAQIAEVQAFGTQATAAPTGLAYSSSWKQQDPSGFFNYNGSAVELTWTAPAGAGYAGFVIQRDNTGDWTGSDLQTWYAPANATRFVNDRERQQSNFNPYAPSWDSNRNRPLSSGTTYSYRVGTIQANGTVVYGSAISATTAAASYTLATPTGLGGSDVSNSAATLSWSAVAGAKGYKVERSLSSSFAEGITAVAWVPGLSYTDTSLNSGTTYYYRVRASDGMSDSAYASANVTTLAAPDAPTNLSATADDGAVRLHWSAPVGKVYGYEIYRGASADALTLYRSYALGQSPLLVPDFEDRGVTAGQTYHYAVRAVLFNSNSPGGLLYSPQSNTASAEVFALRPRVTQFQVNDGSAQRSMVKTLTLAFDAPVTLQPGAVTVVLANGAAVPSTAITVANPLGDQQTYVLSFSGSGAVGGSLADGVYDVVVDASGVQDVFGVAMGGNYTQRFHRLFGDHNGDRRVNLVDYRAMRTTLGRSSGQALYNDWFDVDGSGTVSVLDLSQFRRRFGMRV